MLINSCVIFFCSISGNRESLQYIENVFKNNLRHAILEQLKSPPEGFSNVVRSHFFYKRESLIKVTSDILLVVISWFYLTFPPGVREDGWTV